MFNLLTGDRLWNRFRVDDAQNFGAEGAWLSPLQDAAAENAASRYLLLPLSVPSRKPLTELLSVMGAGLRYRLVASTPAKSRGRRKSRQALSPIPKKLPLLGTVEWIGDPSRDGAAIIAAPPAIPLSKLAERAGALSPEQVLPLAAQLGQALHELLVLLSTSRRPLNISQELLRSLVKLLNPDRLALRTDNAELIFRVDLEPAQLTTEPPTWADFAAPEAYRNGDLTPASLVFGAAKVISYLLGIAAPAPEKTRDKRKQSLEPWAALADWASGKRDPVREFSANPDALRLPAPVRELLSEALAKNRSGRITSPEKLRLRLKSPELTEFFESARCSACGFVAGEGRCACCGKEPALGGSARISSQGLSSISKPGGGTARTRRGTTAIMKGRSSATAAAVLPKIEGMTLIEAGSFLSGEDRTPRTLRAFAIDTVPVTESDYKKYLTETSKVARLNGPGSREATFDKHPVTGVTWYEANDFAEFYGKRLPTIFEWEKASRGTDGRKFSFGNNYKQGMGRLRTFEDGRRSAEAGTAAVGNYPAGASPYGVLDMSGNVLQWTSSARRAGERLFRAVKGSCFLDGSSELARCTSIQYMPPESSEPYLGFRCVKDLE